MSPPHDTRHEEHLMKKALLTTLVATLGLLLSERAVGRSTGGYGGRTVLCSHGCGAGEDGEGDGSADESSVENHGHG
jgi:hypothetical protein